MCLKLFKLYVFLNFLNYVYHFKLDSNPPKINKNQIRYFFISFIKYNI